MSYRDLAAELEDAAEAADLAGENDDLSAVMRRAAAAIQQLNGPVLYSSDGESDELVFRHAVDIVAKLHGYNGWKPVDAWLDGIGADHDDNGFRTLLYRQFDEEACEPVGEQQSVRFDQLAAVEIY